MKYLSLCSGIEAASVAWGTLGWEPVAFSEIEKFTCKLLEYRFPQVPNIGDMTKIDGEKYASSTQHRVSPQRVDTICNLIDNTIISWNLNKYSWHLLPTSCNKENE